MNKKKKNHTNQIKKGPVAHQEDMLIDKNNKSTNKNTQKSIKKNGNCSENMRCLYVGGKAEDEFLICDVASRFNCC